jgi:hypothetical protein
VAVRQVKPAGVAVRVEAPEEALQEPTLFQPQAAAAGVQRVQLAARRGTAESVELREQREREVPAVQRVPAE